MTAISKTVVRVTGLHKSFRLPHEQHSGLKQKLVNTLKGIKGYEDQHVLKDVNFEINEGDFFGIVGRNGSGKSTLLKLLAKIYTPDKGTVDVDGSLVPFIELGVGFNPELTGRENIYMNGAMLGFSREEMDRKYDDIVKFSEIERFMDQKLKNYSSGMQVRLAFSIAIQSEGDILLLDEVLAVGDEAFQRKCFNYFQKLKREKKTVILVTHDMGSVERFCNRAMFIEDGVIKLIGKPSEVADAYSRSNDEAYKERQMNLSEVKAAGFEVTLLDHLGEKKTNFSYGETLTVRLKWNHDKVHYGGVALFSEDGQYIFGTNTYIDNHELIHDKALNYNVKLNLHDGKYFLKASICNVNDLDRIAFINDGPHFTVAKQSGAKWDGLTKLDYKWD